MFIQASSPVSPSRPQNRLPFLLACLSFFGSLAVSSGTFFGIDGGLRFQVTRQLADHARLDVEAPIDLPVGRGGRHFSKWNIGHSLVMLPAYELGKQAAKRLPAYREELREFFPALTNVAFTAALVALMAALVLQLGYSPRTAVVVCVLYAFGTMGWQQAKDSFEHPQIALYFVLLFSGLCGFARTQRLCALLAAGTAWGFSLMTRYSAVLALGGAAWFLFSLAPAGATGRRVRTALRWLLLFALPAIPFLCLDGAYNAARFGDPFRTGFSGAFPEHPHPASFLRALIGLTFHPHNGLFLFNPILLLALIGAPSFLRRHRALGGAILFLVASHVLFYALTVPEIWGGSWAWGPRHLADIVAPFWLLSCPFWEGLRARRPPIAKWALRLLVAVSILIQVESVLVNYNRGFIRRALGIGGHSLQSEALRDSPLVLQAEDLVHLSSNLLAGKRPSRPRASMFRDLSSLDDTLTFGTFQIWWVYALHLGVPVRWVAAYLLVTLAILLLLIGRIGRLARAGPRSG